MNNFVVSARKYRPATFDTVVGQKAIATTLKNAIKKNMLAHAYLFFGPRGVGKTTCARIFAKTINCMQPTADMEACDQCESCISFNENRSFNIHELDAASNNSVEDIRNLIDQVRIPPQVGRFSTYIIDEVHMLSLAAFNAFLKTLEEPPKHAIFILATTEKHKIIPTILSRCQIFDFNRIEIADIVDHLAYIANNEGVSAEAEALNIIAQKADGAMRDALSIYDQIVSFSDNQITYEKVIQNLNVLDYEYYFRIVDSFLNGDFSANLIIYDEILRKGFDGNNFLNGLARHFRDLLISKDARTAQLLEVGASIKDKYIRQSAQTSTSFLFDALEICNQFDINYKSSKNQKLHIELALLQISNLELKKKDQSESDALIPSPEASGPKAEQPERNLPEKPKAPTPVETDPSTQSEKTDLIEKNPVEAEKISSPPPKTSHKMPGSIPSLDSILKNKPTQENVAENTPQREKPETTLPEKEEFADQALTQEGVEKAWLEWLENFKEDQPRIYSNLQSRLPVLKAETRLILNLPNESLLNLLTEKQTQIEHSLQKSLQNHKLSIEFLISEADDTKRKAYTTSEKFQALSERNPYLAEFKNQLGLDVD